jgi:hypothetical protein
MGETSSILLRVRRTTVEDAYVAVPVTEAIVDVQPDGTGSINFEAFVAEALRLSGDPRVQWQIESTGVATHPEQGPLPEGRRCFDAYHPSGRPE